MEIFCLCGIDQNEKIRLELNEVIDFPNRTSYEGGYDIICTLQIDIGCYCVKCDRYFSATGALYRFSEKLKECYTNLFGSAEYRLRLEDDLSFAVSMTSNGHALVKGKFQERPDVNNVFEFEMETDQTCLPTVFQGIDRLQDIYGGMQGVG
ncbi:MAG: hypothetical protein ACLRPX_11475 [Ruthenibacterium sp.]